MAVTTVAFSDLNTWLSNQPDNTVDTPYELEITGLTASDIGTSSDAGTLGYIIRRHYTKYIDLSMTQLPQTTNLASAFLYCYTLVKAPIIQNGVEYMGSTFQGCSVLESAPTIPSSVTNMGYTFKGCIALKDAPNIPNGVTYMTHTFYNCSSLREAPLFPEGVTNVVGAFENCSSLSYKSIIPSSVTYSNYCYENVSTLNWKGTKAQVDYFNPNCPDDCEIQVYNNDRETYEYSIYNIDISILSTYLASLDPNTVSTAYKIYVRGLENVLTEEDVYAMRTAFHANDTKYVDLSYTTIPDWHVYDLLFGGCISLVKPPAFASGWTAMGETFYQCINLKEAPVIPSSVQYLHGTFAYCTSLETPAVLPSGILGTEACYAYSGITTTGDLNKSSLENCAAMFAYCTNLTTVQNLPPNLEYMYDSTIDLEYRKGMFEGCTSIESIPNVPSSVSDGRSAFKDCSSLKTIEEFGVSVSALDSTYFQNMFSGCTSLETIGHKVEYSDDWHLVYLDFDSNTVEGKIYSRDKTSVSITQTTITKNTLSLPLITDELMFDTSISTADLEDIIEGTAQQQGMLDTNYSWFGKIVVPPTGDNFIMYAKNPSKFKSNIDFGGGGAELEIVSTSKSFTPAKDKRIIVDTSGVTVTLNYGGTNGVVAEVFAMESCTLTYYTSSSATSSLSMSACSKAVFVYYNGGWALNANYGTTNSVAVDNMQSVSSNAVASLLNTSLDDTNVVDISSQLTKNLGLTTVHAVRKNNVVQLYLYGDYTGSPSYSTQILASGLPQKYRPMTAEIGSSFAVVSYITSNPYVVPTRLAIGVDGAIRLNETSMPNGAKIVFTVTYIGA